MHRIGAGVYTDTPYELTQTLFVHPDVVYVYAKGQRLVHHIGAGVYTETPSDSIQTLFVHAGVV